MNILIQKKQNGIVQKTWKVTPKNHLYIVGGSKKADLYLPQAPGKVWLGLESRDQEWYLLNMSATEDFVEQKITQSLTLTSSNFDLEFLPLKPVTLWQNQVESNSETVLTIKKLGSSIVDSKSYSLQTFKTTYPNAKEPSTQWQKINDSDWSFKLSKKLLTDSQLISKSTKKLPKSDLFMLLATLFIFLGGMLSYLLLPSHQTIDINLNQSLPPKIVRDTKLKSKTPQRAQESQSGSNFLASNPKIVTQPQQNNSRLADLVSRISKNNKKANIANSKASVKLASADKLSTNQIVTGTTGKIGPANGQNTGGQASGTEIGTLSQGAGGLAAKGNLNKIAGVGGKVGMDILETEADVEGGLDPEVIAQFIRARLGEILYCYERQLSINPGLYGKVTTQFLIESNGHVGMARITQTSLKNASVEGCVTQRIQKWKFPTPKGGSQVSVTYPFLFKNAQ